MRAASSANGLSFRVIAGAHSVILAMDLAEAARAGCLGFSIRRTWLGPAGAPVPADQQEVRWIPNLLRFPKDTGSGLATTDKAPIQKFRWGDYTTYPGHAYRYEVTAQYGAWDSLKSGASAVVEVTTESQMAPETAVFFNRGAAASQAYVDRFGEKDPADSPEARVWLSRGLEEAILAFLAQAKDASYALHASIYEFQKPELLQGLKDALSRGAAVGVVYHSRHKDDKDDTWTKNEAAANVAGLQSVAVQRKANPQSAISHDKFVVLLKDSVPQAVWTGSTNWTEGAIYGQLNVGHALYDPQIAAAYEQLFQHLHADEAAAPLKAALAKLTPVSAAIPDVAGVYPLFSPQSNQAMLDLYGAICANARCLLVCAPFELAAQIRSAFSKHAPDALHFLLVDKTGSLGSAQEVEVIRGEANTEVSVATTLSSPLHDYQNRLLEGKESFHHAGVHIHAKVIAADPFGPDPVVVTGSANYSVNSTTDNDSNSLVIRGNTRVADIYATEFMRMFEHYLFRGSVAQRPADQPMGLAEDDSWSSRYYVPGSNWASSRQLFAGTSG